VNRIKIFSRIFTVKGEFRDKYFVTENGIVEFFDKPCGIVGEGYALIKKLPNGSIKLLREVLI
jgi:hypothetical protein